MKISEKDVRYVAALANLDLREDEVAHFVPQLDAILSYAGKLNEVDTSQVEPMAQVEAWAQAGPAGPEAPERTAALREDARRPGLPREEALGNAPRQGAGYFKVPKVIER